LQPVTEEEKRETEREKRQTKNKKIKFARLKKVSTFAVPKERGKNREKTGSDFRGIKLKVKMVKAIQNI
jgi:hypothetical protein